MYTPQQWRTQAATRIEQFNKRLCGDVDHPALAFDVGPRVNPDDPQAARQKGTKAPILYSIPNASFRVEEEQGQVLVDIKIKHKNYDFNDLSGGIFETSQIKLRVSI